MFNKQKPVPEGVMEKILKEFDEKFKDYSSEPSIEGVHLLAIKDFLKQALQKAGKSAVENWCIHWERKE